MGFFVKDHIKALLLQALLLPSIFCGLLLVIRWGGDLFYVYAWLFLLVVSLVRSPWQPQTFTCTCIPNEMYGSRMFLVTPDPGGGPRC